MILGWSLKSLTLPKSSCMIFSYFSYFFNRYHFSLCWNLTTRAFLQLLDTFSVLWLFLTRIFSYCSQHLVNPYHLSDSLNVTFSGNTAIDLSPIPFTQFGKGKTPWQSQLIRCQGSLLNYRITFKQYFSFTLRPGLYS